MTGRRPGASPADTAGRTGVDTAPPRPPSSSLLHFIASLEETFQMRGVHGASCGLYAQGPILSARRLFPAPSRVVTRNYVTHKLAALRHLARGNPRSAPGCTTESRERRRDDDRIVQRTQKRRPRSGRRTTFVCIDHREKRPYDEPETPAERSAFLRRPATRSDDALRRLRAKYIRRLRAYRNEGSTSRHRPSMSRGWAQRGQNVNEQRCRRHPQARNDARVPSVEPKAVEPQRIVTDELELQLARQIPDVAYDIFTREREGHIRMRIVVGPHQIVLTPPRELPRPREVLEPRAVNVLVEDLAGLTANRERLFVAESLKVVIPLLQDERQPTALALGENEPQLRVTIERARKNEVEERVDHVVGLLIDRSSDLLRSLAPTGIAKVCVTGQDVQVHRRAGFGGRRPQAIIMIAHEGQPGVGDLPDHDPDEPHVEGAMHLPDRRVDVVDRDRRHAEESVRRHLAEVGEEVVVELHGLALRIDVLDAEERHSVVREENFGRYAVAILIEEPRVRIAGAFERLLSEPDHVECRAHRLVQSRRELFPQCVGLHDVRIDRDQRRQGGRRGTLLLVQVIDAERAYLDMPLGMHRLHAAVLTRNTRRV